MRLGVVAATNSASQKDDTPTGTKKKNIIKSKKPVNCLINLQIRRTYFARQLYNLCEQALDNDLALMVPTLDCIEFNKHCEWAQPKRQMCIACDVTPTAGGILRSMVRK